MDVGYFFVNHFKNMVGELSLNIHVPPDGIFTLDFMYSALLALYILFSNLYNLRPILVLWFAYFLQFFFLINPSVADYGDWNGYS